MHIIIKYKIAYKLISPHFLNGRYLMVYNMRGTYASHALQAHNRDQEVVSVMWV
jgi:hypothetical protein